jgi:hypothetical protein
MHDHSSTRRARWHRVLSGVVALVVTLAAAGPAFPLQHDAHQMECCAMATTCHGTFWSAVCCAPPSPAPAPPSSPVSSILDAAAQADLLVSSFHLLWSSDGSLSHVREDAFTRALLDLPPDPSYLLHASFLI